MQALEKALRITGQHSKAVFHLPEANQVIEK